MSRRPGQYDEGTVVGDWTIARRLGKGGNSYVYKVIHSDGTQAALKAVRRNDDRRDERFGREIIFVRDHPSHPGLLPLLDSDKGDRPKWYVMPLAIPLVEHLESATPARILEALTTVSLTLADLCASGVYHRDIKPENLLWHQGRPVVSDFGTVYLPGAFTLTRPDEPIGSVNFMAPEMIHDAHGEMAEYADVYSLAKTTWCLLTHNDVAPPGQLRSVDPSCSLSARLEHPRTGALSRLLERSTSNTVQERPGLAQFAEELGECLASPTTFDNDVDLSIDDVKRRIADATRHHFENEEGVRDRSEFLYREGNQIIALISGRARELFGGIPGVATNGTLGDYGFARTHVFADDPDVYNDMNVGFRVEATLPTGYGVRCAADATVTHGSNDMQVAARISVVGPPDTPGSLTTEMTLLFEDHGVAETGSARLQNIAARVADGFGAALRPSLHRLVEMAEASDPSD